MNYLVDRKEGNPVEQEMKGRLFHSVEEVEQEYGKPDGVVVLNAANANEISGVVLSYPERGILVMTGRENPMDDITGIAPKNMAIIPYVVDEYAVVINTKNPAEPVVYLRVGYERVCHNEDFHYRQLQFVVIMAACKANEQSAQGNALGFYVCQQLSP